MKKFNRQTGAIAEKLAATSLQKAGYTIVKRNFGNRWGEIDIICQDKETLVFVEVKAKTGEEFGMPEEMVSKGKLAQIRKMAQIYTGGKEILARIDVVAVVFGQNGELARLTHYQNVY